MALILAEANRLGTVTQAPAHLHLGMEEIERRLGIRFGLV